MLRWLQSLDLAYSVRNVSRDFATGFLVAEILSRYDSSIHMHSYDNGCNIVKRKDNWRSLCKFFNRADIPYTDDEIGRIIHYEKAATVTSSIACTLCATPRQASWRQECCAYQLCQGHCLARAQAASA